MRRRRPQKMGFEGVGARRPEPYASADRLTVAGVEFTYSKLAGWICGLCTSGIDLRDMTRHARSHAADVARRAALARITGVLELLNTDQLGEVAAILPAVVANPAGFAAVARALTSGERKHPGRGFGPSPDQTIDDHVAALGRHAERAPDLGVGLAIGGLAIDVDSGIFHAGLAAARGVLAVQLASERSR